MCGIAAIIDHGPHRSSLLSALSRAHLALAHRGPDGEGFLWLGREGCAHRTTLWPPPGDPSPSADPIFVLGFHQLKVQDLSDEAIQPLGSSDGLHWIAFNGEIYNASELRSTLRGLGHCFKTHADTEVALAAYREWGTECFTNFNGMWALLIVDLARRTLVGSRDRLGIKPLYYSVHSDRLILASEPQAVVRALEERPAIHAGRFREFLGGLPPQTSDQTSFEGVRLVPAASVFEIDFRADRAELPVFRRFWDLHDFVPSPERAIPFEEACDEVRARLASSIALQAEAAVPIGCMLSGGLDTSLVARSLAAAAQARGDDPIPAYSIVFSDPDMSELPFIWSVVRQGGLRSHTHQLTASQAWQDIDAVVLAQGQPLLGQDLIAQYNAYKLARAHGSVVVLEGQGSDELLAGMPSYAAAIFDELLAAFRLGDLTRELWAESRRRGRSRLRSVGDLARWTSRRVLVPARVRSRPDWLEPAPSGDGRPDEDGWTPSRDPSRLNQHLFRLVTRTNLQSVLQYQDRSAMVHGVESRVPFLDHRFVEYCFTLPSEYKVRNGQRKRVLAEAARGLVPDTVLQRRDKKTIVSKTHWMPLRERHASALREMASSGLMQRAPGLRGRKVIAFVDGYINGHHNDVLSVWRLYTAWRWMGLFDLA